METAREQYNREENSRITRAWISGCEEIEEAIRLLKYGISLLAQFEAVAPDAWQYRTGETYDRMTLLNNLRDQLRNIEWEMDANSHITTVEEHPTPKQMEPPKLAPLDWDMTC